jgi:DNA repair photolyase
MIIQTGMRTDIPAFYSDWFANRLREGFVLVRNPYNPSAVTRYNLNPDVVDMIGFCSKNPAPMLKYMDLLKPYGQYWFVTITPYGKEIEPNVPDKETVMETFCRLSKIVGVNSIGWRYDPILIDQTWSVDRHIEVFSYMAAKLAGFTKICVISFIDLYEKVKRNFPEARTVSLDDQKTITSAFVKIGKQNDIVIKPCGESKSLETLGADCSGCMTVRTFETAIGQNLKVPPNPNNRKECACYLTGDIGAYNTCGHLCRYCYANADRNVVLRNMNLHDPESPFLVGKGMPEDLVHQAKQKSWIDRQMRFDLISFSE